MLWSFLEVFKWRKMRKTPPCLCTKSRVIGKANTRVNLLQQYIPGTHGNPVCPHISSSRTFVARFPFSSHLTKNHLSRFHCFTPWSQFRAGFPFSMLKTALESPLKHRWRLQYWCMQSLTVYKPKRIQIFRFHHISFCMNAYASVMTNKFLCIILQLKQRISVLSMVKMDVKRAAEKHNAEWKSWPRWAPFALEQTPWNSNRVKTWSDMVNSLESHKKCVIKCYWTCFKNILNHHQWKSDSSTHHLHKMLKAWFASLLENARISNVSIWKTSSCMKTC